VRARACVSNCIPLNHAAVTLTSDVEKCLL